MDPAIVNDKLILTENNRYELTTNSNYVEVFVVNWCTSRNYLYNRYVMGNIIRTMISLLSSNRIQLGEECFETHKYLLLNEHMNNMWSTVNMYYINMILNELKLNMSDIDSITDESIKNKAKIILLLNGQNLI